MFGYLGYTFLFPLVYNYSTVWNDFERYSWVFTDSAKQYIDKEFFVGDERKTDAVWRYTYRQHYYVLIWEIRSLHKVDLKTIVIREGVSLDGIDLQPRQTLEGGDFREEEVSLGHFFQSNVVNLDLDTHSKLLKRVNSAKYTGFFGSVKRMALSDSSGDYLVIFNHTRKTSPTLLLFYKSHDSFYLIMVDGDKPFDDKIVDIFKLE